MFDFFDNEKNPFLFMMNIMGNGSAPEGRPAADASDANPSDANPMQLMQQMFQLQMQLMQTVMLMPMQLMQGMVNLMNQAAAQPADTEAAAAQPAEPKPEAAPKSGFKLGNLTVPPELLSKLMQMEMSPENLEKLQGALDFVFEAMPDQKEKNGKPGQEADV